MSSWLGSAGSYSTPQRLARPSVRVFEPPYVAHGPPFICSRGHQQVATQTRVKMERCCGWYNYLYSVSYLTLTAGDKGIKCPSASPKQCKKGPSGAPPFATMATLSAPLATAYPWLHNLPPRMPGRVPERHVGGCAGVWVQSGSLSRQVLAAVVVLSRPGACRSPGLAGTRGASRQVP